MRAALFLNESEHLLEEWKDGRMEAWGAGVHLPFRRVEPVETFHSSIHAKCKLIFSEI